MIVAPGVLIAIGSIILQVEGSVFHRDIPSDGAVTGKARKLNSRRRVDDIEIIRSESVPNTLVVVRILFGAVLRHLAHYEAGTLVPAICSCQS